MKKFFVFFLLNLLLFGAEFSHKLPIEIKQFVESISCFDKRDKMALSAYALALRYRIEHIEDKEALKKSALDYWRLNSIVHDIEERCKFNKIGDVIEEILAPTPSLKKRLRRLRWVESTIPAPDGWVESSERMRQYDKKLLDSIVSNPPKWQHEPPSPYLYDHNLSLLKTLPPKTLPRKLLDQIHNTSFLDPHVLDALVRYHYLAEEMMRQYDRPQKRLSFMQERAWLKECLKLYSVDSKATYTGNFIRSLAASIVFHSHYYPLREEFLPKEIKQYCEHNVTHMSVEPFDVTQDVPLKALPKSPVPQFTKTKQLIESYKKSGLDIQKLQRYFNITQQMLANGSGRDMVRGLQLIRLKNCLDQQDANRSRIFFETYLDEVQAQDLKEEFSNRVLQPQMWWMVTIGMKIKQEGELPELKHFFDCNATSMQIKKSTAKSKKNFHNSSPRKNYDAIISQKDTILKYYAATFVNRPTTDLNNAKAIKSGIIPPKWLEQNSTRIKPIENVHVEISGMPKGGIKLTYRGIPKGRTCERLVTLNFNNTIFFDHKTYDGLDYILIDNKKIKAGRHFNYNYARRLCNTEGKHTISYVREKTVTKHKYRSEPVDTACGKYFKRATIDTFRYSPTGFARSQDGKVFAISGNRSYWYDATIPARADRLPKVVNNAFNSLTLDQHGKYLAVSQGYGFAWCRLKDKNVLLHISHKDPRIEEYRLQKIVFLPEGHLLLGVNTKKQEVSLIDLKKGETLLTFVPKCFVGEKKSTFRGPKVTALAISSDGNTVYVGTNLKKIEIWRLEQASSKHKEIKAKWIKTLELPREFKVGAMLPDPDNPDQLYVAMDTQNLNLINTQSGKILMTYIADKPMRPRMLQLSDDGRYIMVSGKAGVYIWKYGEKIQWDIFNGDRIKGGVFVPGSDDVITVGAKIERWSPKK